MTVENPDDKNRSDHGKLNMTIIEQWRKDHNWTQAKLAEQLNVTVVTVSRWETEATPIPPYVHLALQALSQAHDDPNSQAEAT